MAGYIGPQPVPQATQNRETFTATASQTIFNTGGYTPGYIDVFLNGVKLVDTTDYTATNGSDVVLTSGAAASDTLEVVAYTAFTVADQDFTGDLTVDGSTFVVDSTNNRVGIGTSSPSANLHLSGESQSIRLETTNDSSTFLDVRANSGTGGSFYVGQDSSLGGSFGSGAYAGVVWQSGSYPIVFATNNTEAARIDASGNLLVGKTSADGGATTGLQAAQNGNTYITRASGTANVNTVLTLNRLTSDGDILRFLKDGTTVGSIGTVAGDLVIDGASGDTGLRFLGSTIRPRDNGAISDGGVDLGASNGRFKDLYLSGGVFLGGTGASNQLTDYETGTWTPIVEDLTGNQATATVNGSYTKVGNIVYATCEATGINTTGLNAAERIYIDGWPFSTQNAGGSPNRTAAVYTNSISFNGGAAMIAAFGDNSSRCTFLNNQDATTHTVVTVSDLTSGSASIEFSIVYDTT